MTRGGDRGAVEEIKRYTIHNDRKDRGGKLKIQQVDEADTIEEAAFVRDTLWPHGYIFDRVKSCKVELVEY